MADGPHLINNLLLSYMGTLVTLLETTEIHLNESNHLPEYFGYIRSNHDPTLLVSPLVVAGIVIGLVVFLSCVTIIIGSLRKDGRDRDWRIENPSYDGISYAPSFGDLSSVCTGDISSALDFATYLGLNVSYQDFPPSYDDCVATGTSELYLPSDEPPPYSLEDPQRQCGLTLNITTEEVALRSHENTEDNLRASLSTSDLHAIPPNRTMSKTGPHLSAASPAIQRGEPPPAQELGQ